MDSSFASFLDLVQDITSTTIQLSLTDTTSDFIISCRADFTNSTRDVYAHAVGFLFHGGQENGTTTHTVHGLFPETTYNCCISYERFQECSEVLTEAAGSEGLSAAAAGALGGFIGLLITMVTALIVAAVVVSVMVTVKKKRAIARAKTRPVLRNDSKRYNRRTFTEDKASTPGTRHTPSPLTTPTTHSHATLPHTKLTPPTRKQHGKTSTMPQLKPPLPLKPPIAAKTNHPLRRARSQPESIATKLPSGDEDVYTLDGEHIYDDAEVSFKTRRIVSRENVAYSQYYGEEEQMQEYEPLY